MSICKLKKLLAVLLSVLLLLPGMTPLAIAAEKDIMDNYVVGLIFDKRALGTRTSTGYGGGWVNNLNIDVSGVAPANRALSLRLYIENMDHPGDISALLAPTAFGQFELGDSPTKVNLTKQFRTLKCADGSDFVPGKWNDILIPFSEMSGDQTTFNTNPIVFYRLEFARLEVPFDNYVIRMSNVCIVDTSRPAQKPEQQQEWDTSYFIADIPFTADMTIRGQGKSTPTTGASKAFDPIDASRHNPKMIQVMLDIEVQNLTNPGDVSVLSQMSGQIELTSSGKWDQEELAIGPQTLDWKEGKHTYSYMVSSGSPTNGTLNYANINFMRIYMNNWPEDFTDTITIKVTNVRLVDITNSATMPTYFKDGMLFQQNKPMNIWGYAVEGTPIKAELFKGDDTTPLETKETVTGDSGRWDISFSPRKGSYDAYTIVVTSGDEEIRTIRDIAIGELWLASGQSNMAYSVSGSIGGADEMKNANNRNLRFFLMSSYPSGQTGEQPFDPAKDIPGAYWGYGDRSGHVGNCSAVAYYFAKRLQPALDVPVGILNCATGGTVIEAWLPRTAIEEDAQVKLTLQKYGLYNDEEWWPTSAGGMSTLYNQKVGPLEGINIAGTIWYQGESNSGRSEIYDLELNLLKKSWGERFGFENNDMPLIVAQVAPHYYDNGPQHLGWLAEAMIRSYLANKDDKMSVLTIYDLPLTHVLNGVSSDPIHPRDKNPVGERFYHSVMNLVYGDADDLYTAPYYKSMEIKGNAIEITFEHVGKGLGCISGSDLHGFTIAGEDNVYVPAQAEIVDEDTVRVWNNRVSNPKNVIYAFGNYNQNANLAGFSLDGSYYIPVAPFRTAASEINDKTSAPSPNVTYFTFQDWMHADKDEWVYDNQAQDPNKSGFHPSWKVGTILSDAASVAYGYTSVLKLEGLGALRVEYTGATGKTVGISPIFNYVSLQFKPGNYNYLTVNVFNPNPDAASVALQFKSGGQTYTAAVAGTDNYAQAVSGKTYVPVTFNLRKLKTGNTVVTDTKTLLNGITDMQFTFTGLKGDGAIYLDAITVGMTDAVKTDQQLMAEYPEMPTANELKDRLQDFVESVDESRYTPESLAADEYVNAKAQVQAALSAANFVQLDKAFTAYLKAVANLVAVQELNLDALREAIETAENVDVEKYTEESVAQMQAVLDEAKELLAEAEKEDTTVTQKQIDDMAAQLLAAVEELVKKVAGLDLDALREAIETAENVDVEKYTEESVAQMQAVLDEAKELLAEAEKEDTTVTQEQVDEMTEQLLAAVAALEEKPQEPAQWGDLNGDGKVTSTDARLTLQAAVGKIQLTEEQQAVADVDGNGKINTTDARYILQYAVQKIDKFPVENQ